jgi:hypothetical protein
MTGSRFPEYEHYRLTQLQSMCFDHRNTRSHFRSNPDKTRRTGHRTNRTNRTINSSSRAPHRHSNTAIRPGPISAPVLSSTRGASRVGPPRPGTREAQRIRGGREPGAARPRTSTTARALETQWTRRNGTARKDRRAGLAEAKIRPTGGLRSRCCSGSGSTVRQGMSRQTSHRRRAADPQTADPQPSSRGPQTNSGKTARPGAPGAVVASHREPGYQGRACRTRSQTRW